MGLIKTIFFLLTDNNLDIYSLLHYISFVIVLIHLLLFPLQDRMGWTALDCASFYGREACVTSLLVKSMLQVVL